MIKKPTLLRVCVALLLVGSFVPSCVAGKKDGPVSPPWKLAWSDEFSGENVGPDPAKWQVVTGGGGWYHNELEYYTARTENLRQSDGHLIIEARKEEYSGFDDVKQPYTSARILTQNRFSQRYGRFEARIKLPAGKGMWPAFWMLGDDHTAIGWPKCGEIDVMESIGDPHKIYGTLHGPGYSGAKGLQRTLTLADNGFHVYGIEWEPDEIRFYVDKQMYHRETRADLPPGSKWVFDHPFYLLLNLAVGGSWPGNPDASTVFPQQLVIDYVRVYER